MLSGLVSKMHRRHKNRTLREQSLYSGDSHVIEVESKTLNHFCDEQNLSEVDLLLIDVEGAEVSIIRSIDFERVKINIICIERNFSSRYVLQRLSKSGFMRLLKVGSDDIYIHKRLI